jgi:FkbM family methyltransferase
MTPQESYKKWVQDKGDETHIINYPLNENSWVLELGGYKGIWTKRIFEKFKCNILVIEPVPEFYSYLNSEFSKPEYENKVKLENLAISTEQKKIKIFPSGDSSSTHLQNGEGIDIECQTIEFFLNKYNIDLVDLVQINIEGEEYPLLENWTSSNLIDKFKFIQVQFHNFIDNHIQRRSEIQNRLISQNFENIFQYDFIWESWKKM